MNKKKINKNILLNTEKIKPDGLGKAGAILLIIGSSFDIFFGINDAKLSIFAWFLIIVGILGLITGARFLMNYEYKTDAIVLSSLILFPYFLIPILAIIFSSISKKENKKVIYIVDYENKNNNDNITINKKDIDEEIDLSLLKEKLDLQEEIIKDLEDKFK